MTKEIINKDELKKLRVLLESGQRLAISTKEFEKVFDEIDRLEQENKELKEKIIKLSEKKGHLIVENNTLKEENEGLKIKHQRYRECSMQLNKKYKSALEEIRKIAKNPILSYRESIINIQDKINEVLNDI